MISSSSIISIISIIRISISIFRSISSTITTDDQPQFFSLFFSPSLSTFVVKFAIVI